MTTANTTNTSIGSESRKTKLEEKNQTLLTQKLEQFNKRSGVRVGDYVRLPTIDKRQNEYTRITHVWSETAQTGGGGSYFIGDSGCLEYSGGLDSGLALDALVLSGETKQGAVWFFSGDEVRAHNGVTLLADMRVFTVKAGADVSGCYTSLGCSYSLSVLADKHIETFGSGYKYLIRHNQCSYKAFRKEEEAAFLAWLKGEDLILLNGRIEYPAKLGKVAA